MAAPLQIRFTHDHATACALRDAGFEPVECAFGQHGSVLGPFALDHHGTESHREGVALRACQDHYGALAHDPRFVVTGTPDADAVLAIVALAGLVPREALDPAFYALVNRHDTDPIGADLLASPEGLRLAWFNQRERLFQNEEGFRAAVGHMIRLLSGGVDARELAAVSKSDRGRRRRAGEGILARLDAAGHELAIPDPATQPVRRGADLDHDPARILVVRSNVWGFDVWYRLAPVVVSYAERMAKVTIGCPDSPTAAACFGSGGLMQVWPVLGVGWGGRDTIGGSARGERLGVSQARITAERLLPLLHPGA